MSLVFVEFRECHANGKWVTTLRVNQGALRTIELMTFDEVLEFASPRATLVEVFFAVDLPSVEELHYLLSSINSLRKVVTSFKLPDVPLEDGHVDELVQAIRGNVVSGVAFSVRNMNEANARTLALEIRASSLHELTLMGGDVNVFAQVIQREIKMVTIVSETVGHLAPMLLGGGFLGSTVVCLNLERADAADVEQIAMIIKRPVGTTKAVGVTIAALVDVDPLVKAFQDPKCTLRKIGLTVGGQDVPLNIPKLLSTRRSRSGLFLLLGARATRDKPGNNSAMKQFPSELVHNLSEMAFGEKKG